LRDNDKQAFQFAEAYARSRTAALEKQLAEAERENRELRAALLAALRTNGPIVISKHTTNYYQRSDGAWVWQCECSPPRVVGMRGDCIRMTNAHWCEMIAVELEARAALSGSATEQKEGE